MHAAAAVLFSKLHQKFLTPPSNYSLENEINATPTNH